MTLAAGAAASHQIITTLNPRSSHHHPVNIGTHGEKLQTDNFQRDVHLLEAFVQWIKKKGTDVTFYSFARTKAVGCGAGQRAKVNKSINQALGTAGLH